MFTGNLCYICHTWWTWFLLSVSHMTWLYIWRTLYVITWPCLYSCIVNMVLSYGQSITYWYIYHLLYWNLDHWLACLACGMNWKIHSSSDVLMLCATLLTYAERLHTTISSMPFMHSCPITTLEVVLQLVNTDLKLRVHCSILQHCVIVLQYRTPMRLLWVYERKSSKIDSQINKSIQLGGLCPKSPKRGSAVNLAEAPTPSSSLTIS